MRSMVKVEMRLDKFDQIVSVIQICTKNEVFHFEFLQ